MMEPVEHIFDSHAHYDNERFDPDRDELLQAMHKNGVEYIFNAGNEPAANLAGIALAEQYDFVYCGTGIHPHEAATVTPDYLALLQKQLEHPKVKALGEIGLDYYYDFSPREVQKKVFEEQLILAKELDVPVIIHDRDAHEDTMILLKKYQPKGIVHCFSGSAEMAKEILKLGMYIGFTGVITFKNARRALEALKVIPTDRLLLETDCPYMAPEPYRGKRCESSMICETAAKMAEIKGLPLQQMIQITCENALQIYNIK